MRKSIQTTYCLMLVSVLLFALALPCHAMVQPTVNWVTSMEEFLAQYHSDDAPDSTRGYGSQQPLLCSGETVLDKTRGNVELMGLAGLQVKAGARLTLNNPNLLVMGPPPVITVEAGGTLHVLNWNPMMSNGSMPTAGMIRVEAGGTLEMAKGLELPADMVVNGAAPPDANSPPATSKPPDTTKPPDTRPEPITSLWGEVLKVNSGKLNYGMTLPLLSEKDLGTIAIERSTDGEHWTLRETFVWDEARRCFTAGPNSYSAMQFGLKNTYIAYVEDTDYRDFYLRLTLVGSRYAGVSNVVKVTIPEGAGPGESVMPPATGDYESNEGNQGGGGQGESDRTGQQEPTPTPSETPTPTPTPTPVEIPPEDDSSKEENPGNALAGTTDREEAASGLQHSSTGASYSTIAAVYPADDAYDIGDAMRPVRLPAQPPPQTDAPHSVAEVEPKEEPIPATEEKMLTAATEEFFAVQQEAVAPMQRDGDRGGQAVLITLILGVGVAAAGTITSWNRFRRRRP